MNVNVKGILRFSSWGSPAGIFTLLFLFTIIDRIFLIGIFGTHWTSNDDLVFWLGARDYAHGIFHEPFMYGQDYNYMTESFFAIPFVWLGIPYNISMPVVTSLMALLPFWSFGYDFFRKKNFTAAFFIISIPLFLSPEYGVMTTITRGFVNGLFLLSFFPFAARVKRKGLRFFLMAAVCAVASIVNPNALVVAVPLLFSEWMEQMKNLKFYVFTFIGAIPFVVLFILSRHYYTVHPEALVHSLHGGWRMSFFGNELIPESLCNLDSLFRFLGIIWWKNGSMLPVLLLITIIALFARKEFKPAFAVLSGLLIILVSFGYPKVHDGFDTPFYNESRNFLAAPLLAGIALAPLLNLVSSRRIVHVVFLVIALLFLLYKTINCERDCNRMTSHHREAGAPITIIRVEELENTAHKYDSLAAKNDADLIVCLTGPDLDVAKGQFICLGGELLNENFPANYFPQYERRSWLTSEMENTVYRNILFIGGQDEVQQRLKSSFPDTEELQVSPRVMLVKNYSGSFASLRTALKF